MGVMNLEETPLIYTCTLTLAFALTFALALALSGRTRIGLVLWNYKRTSPWNRPIMSMVSMMVPLVLGPVIVEARERRIQEERGESCESRRSVPGISTRVRERRLLVRAAVRRRSPP